MTTDYSRTAQISDIEWQVIQKFRWLLLQEYGAIVMVKVKDGKVTDIEKEIEIRIKTSDNRQMIKNLQT